jgi:hypothetical protein
VGIEVKQLTQIEVSGFHGALESFRESTYQFDRERIQLSALSH